MDVHGVGYEITIPVSAFSSLPERGQPVQLHIHTHVREDALALFGFLTAADKTLFEKLITVSGIGPSLAIKALSGLTAGDLVAAIRSGAIESWCAFPVSERRPRSAWCSNFAISSISPAFRHRASAAPKSRFSDTEEDVISALMNFGANRASAEARGQQGAIGQRIERV